MKLTVCIPMYNERLIAADTAKTLEKAMKELSQSKNIDIEIIFSDDGSTDKSAEIVQTAVCSSNRGSTDSPSARVSTRVSTRVIRYEKNLGKGAAVRAAMKESDGDVVMYTDCDLAYGTDAIGRIFDYIKDDTDIVIGSRNLTDDGYEGYTLIRKLASKAYIKVLCVIAGFRMTDSQCGFKAFRGDAARKIFSECTTNGFAFDFEVMLRAKKLGYKISEMPVKIINHRQSTVHVLSDSFKMISDILKIKKNVGK